MQVGGCFYQGKKHLLKGYLLHKCIHYTCMYEDLDRRTVDVLSIVFVNNFNSIQYEFSLLSTTAKCYLKVVFSQTQLLTAKLVRLSVLTQLMISLPFLYPGSLENFSGLLKNQRKLFE